MSVLEKLFSTIFVLLLPVGTLAQEPVEIGFLWHMHQPTYRPGETIFETENSGVFSFSLVDVHNQRLGPYTSWPRNAIQSGLSLPNLGASVSFFRFSDPESESARKCGREWRTMEQLGWAL